MLNSSYLQYQRTQTQTADPSELVVMLYEGAVKFLQRASFAIKAGDHQMAHTAIVRAQDIISELNVTLDHGYGSVAANLSRVYEYLYWRLVEANCKKDLVAIEEVLGLVRELLPAWQEAVRANRQRQVEPPRRAAFHPVAVGAR